VILFVESSQNKFRRWRRTLTADQVIGENPEKCFVYDSTARPIPYLPGVYVNMPAHKIESHRVRPVTPWHAIVAPDREAPSSNGAPPLLFSFRGYLSHPVRKEVLALEAPGECIRLTETHRWWDYGSPTDDLDRRTYLEEIRDSAFVLCPRGLGPGSIRLYETMQLGRVPVIIADEWAAPPGIPWHDFSLRVPESRVANIPELLDRFRSDAQEMGRLAREAWERWMKPGPVLLRAWMDAIEEMISLRPAGWSEKEFHAQWNSQRFWWSNQIHPVQGAFARMRRALT
jgi:hypothetical protein